MMRKLLSGGDIFEAPRCHAELCRAIALLAQQHAGGPPVFLHKVTHAGPTGAPCRKARPPHVLISLVKGMVRDAVWSELVSGSISLFSRIIRENGKFWHPILCGFRLRVAEIYGIWVDWSLKRTGN